MKQYIIIIIIYLVVLLLLVQQQVTYAFQHVVCNIIPSSSSRRINHWLLYNMKKDSIVAYNENSEEGNINNNNNNQRRSLLSSFVVGGTGFITSMLLSDIDNNNNNIVYADTGAEVRGTKVNAFNGLAFQYRGNDFNGLQVSDIPNNEPTISYTEFVTKLRAGDISYVEFYAPDGDVAYATILKSKERIRIGEGYPIEQHDGYSSPSFAIRTVKNANVPYKFIVPALSTK